MAADNGQQKKERQLTGRTVLICFVTFFAVVAAVNGIMVRAATSTFGGVETESAYKAGLAFKNEIAAARAQDERHLQVQGTAQRLADGDVAVDLTVAGGQGVSVGGLNATARFAHPTDARFDRRIALVEVAPGRFTGKVDAAPGQWDLVLDLERGDERVFRSKNRIGLR